jgi:ribonucleotide monophosphatase NagD (HAD superfamily)
MDGVVVPGRTPVRVGPALRTDLRGGIEAGMDTVPVLSGKTSDVARTSHRPRGLVASGAEIET